MFTRDKAEVVKHEIKRIFDLNADSEKSRELFDKIYRYTRKHHKNIDDVDIRNGLVELIKNDILGKNPDLDVYMVEEDTLIVVNEYVYALERMKVGV